MDTSREIMEMIKVITSNEAFTKAIAEVISQQLEAKLTSALSTQKAEYDNKITALERKIDGLNQQLNRNTVRIYGIPEEHDDLTAVKTELSNKLKTQICEADIANVHRVGKFQKDATNPRAMILQFTTSIRMKEVISRRKLLKDSGVVIAEELTPARHALMKKAKVSYGVRNVWSNNGTVFAWANGARIIVTSDLLAARRASEETEASPAEPPSNAPPVTRSQLRGNRKT